MKKNLLLLAAMAFGAFAFTACGGSDSEGSDTVWSGKPNYDKPANADNTKAYKSTDGKTFVEFGPGKTAVIGYNPNEFTVNTDKVRPMGVTIKTSDDQAYYVGVYAIKGTVTFDDEHWFEYELPGWGIVRIQSEGVDKTLIIATTDGEELVKKVREEDKLYKDVTSEDICRTWAVQNTEFQYTEVDAHGKRTLQAKHNFPGCDLKAMAEWLKENHGVDIAEDFKITGDMKVRKIETIDFTPYGTFCIKLTDENCVGSWKWYNEPLGVLNFSWFSADMHNSFENGTATVRPMGNILELTLEGAAAALDNGKAYSVKLTALMTEAK